MVKTIVLLVALLVATPAFAADHYYAITGTANRDGVSLKDGGNGGGCPPDVSPAGDNNDAVEEVGSNYIVGLDWSFQYRVFFSFSLASVTGTVDSARVKLVVSSKVSTDWPQGVEFYYGDAAYCISACDQPLGSPWAQCTDALITIPAGDIPAVNDSLHLSVTAEQLGTIGSGHCFDLKLVATSEDSVCEASGANSVGWHMTEAASADLRPVLYVWSTSEDDDAITFCNFRNSALQKGINNADPKHRKLGSPMLGIHRIQGGS